MADALTFDDCAETSETRVFIRLVDEFFDCLNVRNKFEGKHKRKEARQPYSKPNDHRFKVTQGTATAKCLHEGMCINVMCCVCACMLSEYTAMHGLRIHVTRLYNSVAGANFSETSRRMESRS